MCGIQVCYAAQINMGTSELLLLGISSRTVSLAWLAGPLSGLIVQPIIGHISDGCTASLGRRRPFLLAGTFCTTVALLLFSNARLLFPNSAALSIAVVTFFFLDFSIQAIQAPLRALITDVVPRPQRSVANAYVGVFTGLGNLLGGLLTATELSVLFPMFRTDTQALFFIAALILLFTVAACVLVTEEKPLERSYFATNEELAESARAMNGYEVGWKHFMTKLAFIPRPFWQVFFVQLCTWCGFFTLFVYVNSWVGSNIFNGDGSAPQQSTPRLLFDKGVRLGGKGNAFTALVTLIYALILPALIRHNGVLLVYGFSQFVEAACLMLAPLLRGRDGELPSFTLKALTLVDIGLFGIVWATTMAVPWTLIGNALECDDRYRGKIGLYTTLFNASQSFPQLVVALIAPVVLSLSDDNPAMVMATGGVCAFVGMLLVFLLRVDIYEDREAHELTSLLSSVQGQNVSCDNPIILKH